MASIGTNSTQTVTPIDTTIYAVQVTDTFGCIAVDSVIVNVNPIPSVTTSANLTYCAGDLVPTSTYTSVPTGSTYNWFHTNTAIGLTPANGTSNTPGFTATNLILSPDTTTISVIPELNGCYGDTIDYLIVVNPTPSANILPSILLENHL